MMKTQHVALALTVANAALLCSLAHPRAISAPVMRDRALEIVDEHGRVRAEIKVRPAQPKLKMPNSTTRFPEIVELRLISSQNSPHVKLGASEDGSGLVLGV